MYSNCIITYMCILVHSYFAPSQFGGGYVIALIYALLQSKGRVGISAWCLLWLIHDLHWDIYLTSRTSPGCAKAHLHIRVLFKRKCELHLLLVQLEFSYIYRVETVLPSTTKLDQATNQLCKHANTPFVCFSSVPKASAQWPWKKLLAAPNTWLRGFFISSHNQGNK
jgi:hypothetical protein